MKLFRIGLVVTLATACVLGLVLGGVMLSGTNPFAASHAAAAQFQVGDSVRTSFGYIAVEHAEAISGLSETDVAGAHGVPGLVQAGTIDVQVGATLTNQGPDVLSYAPEQFELLDGKGAPIDLERAPQLPGVLQPNAAIDITLDFVTTADARPFTVRFVDPATKQTLLVTLGAVGCIVQSGTGIPLPVQQGCSVPTAGHSHDTGGTGDTTP
jgi:hypothetical protein